VELYARCERADSSEALEMFLCAFHQRDPSALSGNLYRISGEPAVLHAFRVASSLDSMVIGEPQILGQVREAYQTAEAAGTLGPTLGALRNRTVAAARRTRTETGIGAGAVSVSYVAVELARKIFGDLKGRTVLVLGAGEMGKLTAIHMRSQGIGRLLISSRTAAHAKRLAETIGGSNVVWESLDAALADTDILITATGASTPIISRARVEQAMKARRQRPLFIIDIAVPRDVDAAAGEIEQVFLYNIDDLQAVVQENLSKRGAEASEAERIVTEEVERFGGWLNSRGAIPTIVALRQRFESVRQSELRRLEPKLASLPPEARARVDEITRLILEKLLISPTEQLKSSDAETVTAYSDALNRLFALAGEDSAEESAYSAAGPTRSRKKPSQ
jgi:glutamyl-tRNA reductase